MDKLDFELFKGMFHESWHKKMKDIIESPEVYQIYEKLREKTTSGRKLTPLSKDVFKSFEYTDVNNIKVVWVLQSPYPHLYKDGYRQATGIPMDCSYSKDGKIQPSLEKFYEAIQNVYKKEVERSISLKYLLDQGVFLLNSDLTCEVKKPDSHEGLWQPFMKKLFEDILFYNNGLIYIFSGKSSKRLEKFVNTLGNYLFYTEHPAAASYQEREWNHENIFLSIDKLVKSNYNTEIIWNPADIPPF